MNPIRGDLDKDLAAQQLVAGRRHVDGPAHAIHIDPVSGKGTKKTRRCNPPAQHIRRVRRRLAVQPDRLRAQEQCDRSTRGTVCDGQRHTAGFNAARGDDSGIDEISEADEIGDEPVGGSMIDFQRRTRLKDATAVHDRNAV